MAIEPPFVGRAEELRLLKELLHATGREGKARVVSVTGIGGHRQVAPGLGAPEVRRRARPRRSGGTTAAARPTATGITFWALGEMVRMRAGIAETDAAGRLAVEARRLGRRSTSPDEDERRWLEPRLAFLLGLDERPAGGGEELFAAWRTFFERISDARHGRDGLRGPAVGRRRAARLHRVACSSGRATSPIFIVTLARPELADRRPNWGAGQRNFAVAAPRAALRRGDGRAGPRAWCPAPTTPPSAGSSSGPRACRCTRSRRSGCSPTAASSARARTRTSSSATSASSRCPRRCTRSSRRGWTRSDPRTARCCRTPPSSARASRSRRSRR